jgi:hypothetical protein
MAGPDLAAQDTIDALDSFSRHHTAALAGR